jgi:UDP-N-acetylmuramoyl-tripeptide--D-alanyl-D-alanine ligase
MVMSLREAAGAMGVSPDPQRVDREITGWSVDSRSVQRGDLFFALRGPNHDGHAYVGAALEAGAVAAVVEGGRAQGDLLAVPD